MTGTMKVMRARKTVADRLKELDRQIVEAESWTETLRERKRALIVETNAKADALRAQVGDAK